MDPPASTEEAAKQEHESQKKWNGSGDSRAGKETSTKEVAKSAEKPAVPVKKIKHCSAKPHHGRSHSPPPVPPLPAGPPPVRPATSCWDGLMKRATFEAAPVECFKHAPMSQTWRNVCAGLKVEVAQHGGRHVPVTYWVATLLQVQGYRGLFRPEGLGSDSSLDRWIDIWSPDVKPVGWCESHGLPLTPPPAAGPAADWQKRLVSVLTGSRTLPVAFYEKVMANVSRCGRLSAGQILEVVDKACVSQVRAARVTRAVGRRLHVHYLDAPEEDGGFWCHDNSPLVHPVGWALAVGHRIQAPDSYLERCETGRFLPTDATEDCLPAPPPVTHAGFKVGMRLEAVDPLNLGSIGVATVRQVLGNHYIMVRLETDPESDWFCYHASSPYIFPAGFCRTVGIALTPPHGYGHAPFLWEVYLRAEGGVAAPAHLFHRPPISHGFQTGHKLEAVDLMDPQLVCVATVGTVVGRLLRIHFDGWEDQFDQWADVESPDLFPVGWCQLVGYPLEPPRPQEKTPVKRVPKRRPRGRGRGRGGGRLGRGATARRAAAGDGADSESESVAESTVESAVAESVAESTVESVAESAAGSAARTSTPHTPDGDMRLVMTPSPTADRPSSAHPAAESGAAPVPDSALDSPDQRRAAEAGKTTDPSQAQEPTPEAGTQPMEVCDQQVTETGDQQVTETADPPPAPDAPMETA